MPRSDPKFVSNFEENSDGIILVESIVREEGHIYSLAATNDLLYTGSDNNCIRVWKNLNEFSEFKSNSGLVKAIVICRDERVFTGHQDGKIRVWKVSGKNPRVYTRAGSLPALKDVLKRSVKPSNYVEVRRRRKELWIKHSDAVSSLSLVEDQGLLYSASWDRTVKVWRIHDLKCIESIRAHDDAVNSVVATGGSGWSGESLVFTGSADGTVKVWKREVGTKRSTHSLVQTLLKQESAITALVTSRGDQSKIAVYSGSSDGAVNFWEMGEKKMLKHGGLFKKHRLAVLCLAAAGRLLFSGGADKKICVWRREGRIHTCVSVLTGHTGPVKCLAVAEPEEEDGGDKRLVVYSGSLDKSVKVWRVPCQ